MEILTGETRVLRYAASPNDKLAHETSACKGSYSPVYIGIMEKKMETTIVCYIL